MFKDITFKEFIAPIIMIGVSLTVITIFLFNQPILTPPNVPDEVHRVCGVEDKVRGIDVSYWQATIDWDKLVAETDISFGIARVSDGMQKIDPKFEEYWSEMERVGLIRGAYQFFRPNQDAKEQAALFITLLEQAGGLNETDMPPTLDIEVTGGMTKEQILISIYDWTEYVIAHTNRVPIIYTGPSFWDSAQLGGAYSNYPLWIAHYTGATCPWAPDGWDKWSIWQYTGEGKLPGIYRSVDINVFNGDLTDLQYFIKVSDINYIEKDASVADVVDADIIDVEVEAEASVDVVEEDVVEKKTEASDIINEFPNIFDAGGPTPPSIGCSCTVPGR